MTNDGSILRFLGLALRLKRVRRQGWLDRGVREPESAADHSWGVALLAWTLAAGRPELNRERVLLLGLLHDLPEALAGDATPFDPQRGTDGSLDASYFSEEPAYSLEAATAKRALEVSAMVRLLAGLAPALADEIRAAWEEYEGASTPEARFVKQVDKLETLLQAELYRADQPELVIESFWRGARRDITDPELAAQLDELEQDDDG